MGEMFRRIHGLVHFFIKFNDDLKKSTYGQLCFSKPEYQTKSTHSFQCLLSTALPVVGHRWFGKKPNISVTTNTEVTNRKTCQ